MTEAVEDVTRHVGIVALNVPSILREFDLSENEAAANKLDAASSATSSVRFISVCGRYKNGIHSDSFFLFLMF